MSKIFAIESVESQYQGLHGISSRMVIECNDLDEACSIGRQESIDLIYSYGLEPVPDGENWKDEEECEFAFNEMIMYSVWEVPDPKGYTVEELDQMFYDHRTRFIEEYCVDV